MKIVENKGCNDVAQCICPCRTESLAGQQKHNNDNVGWKF